MAEQEPTVIHAFFQPRPECRTPSDINFLFRLPEKVAASGDCWLWTRATTPNGYGTVNYRKWMRPIHRVVYQLCVGPIEKGLNVCHRCDVPLCVRPDHLFLGTQKENVHDCMSKGRLRPRRSPAGSSNPNAKLTEVDVREIKRLLAEGGYGVQRRIQQEYRLSRAAVGRIARGLAWGHVALIPPGTFGEGDGI